MQDTRLDKCVIKGNVHASNDIFMSVSNRGIRSNFWKFCEIVAWIRKKKGFRKNAKLTQKASISIWNCNGKIIITQFEPLNNPNGI